MSGGDPSNGLSESQENSSLLLMEDIQEYETQFFGFTPKSFVDGVYNAIFEYLQDGIELLEKYLLSEFKNDGVSQEEIREGSEKLLAYFRLRFDKACDKLEKYLMKNIFHISSKVLLPSDSVHQNDQHTESEEQKLDEEIKQLHIKIKNMKYMNAHIKQYIVDMEMVQTSLDTVLSKMESLEKMFHQTGVSDIKECIIFIASKIGRIQSKLNEINSNQLQ